MNEVQKFISENQNIADAGMSFLQNFGPKAIGAILVLFIGFKVIHIIEAFIKKAFKKAKLDPMLESFIESIVSILLKVLIIITAAGIVGVQTTSFVALIGAAGLAIGMALSGTLQNFAGGVMILVLKPYKIKDYISVAGYEGFVKEIHIFNTILLTPDNKTVIIPNSEISDGSMINYSSQPLRRVHLDIGIDYGDDIDLAKATLQEIANNNKKVVKKEETIIGVCELGDNAVVITFRPFVKTSDYWPARFELLETIKKTFDEKGLNFPFPQRQVHVTKEKSGFFG